MASKTRQIIIADLKVTLHALQECRTRNLQQYDAETNREQKEYYLGRCDAYATACAAIESVLRGV